MTNHQNYQLVFRVEIPHEYSHEKFEIEIMIMRIFVNIFIDYTENSSDLLNWKMASEDGENFPSIFQVESHFETSVKYLEANRESRIPKILFHQLLLQLA